MVGKIITKFFSTHNILIVENSSLIQNNLHNFDELAEKKEARGGSSLLRGSCLFHVVNVIGEQNQKCNRQMNPSKSKECSLVIEE